jgi:predicted XRE-type DNA-binding protein
MDSRAPPGATGSFGGEDSCRPCGLGGKLCSAVPDLTVRANAYRPCGADDLDIGGVVDLGEEIFAGENLYDLHSTMVPDGENWGQSRPMKPSEPLLPGNPEFLGAIEMDEEKRIRLEAHGWKAGSTEELLGLTPEEAAYIELRLKLSDALRELRKKKHLTQAQLAEMLQSSQSRIANIEAADESVSLDLLIRSLLALGATDRDLAEVIMGKLAKAS